MPAGSGVDLSRPWVAWSDESGEWRESNIDNLLALQRRINDVAWGYSLPRRYVMGIDPATHFTFDERKPVGNLTKTHRYTDNDGDWVEIDPVDSSDPDDVVALIETGTGEDGTYAAYVRAVDSVPLALNVLGYNRDEVEAGGYINEPTFYRGQEVSALVPRNEAERDRNVARAIDLLRGADVFDRRDAERRAAKEAADQRKAEQEARVAAKEASRAAVAQQASRLVIDGVTAVNVDVLQIAIADYKKAVAAVGAPSTL